VDELQKIIRRRRTSKPITFSAEVPDPGLVRELIEVARHAPNHHKTEPARFYLLGREKIGQVGKLFGAVAAGDGSDPSLVEKGKRKEQEWSSCPGLLVVTCHTDQDSDLARRYPDLAREDYATCSCICQNLLLLMENKGISSSLLPGPSKWWPWSFTVIPTRRSLRGRLPPWRTTSRTSLERPLPSKRVRVDSSA
jgi:nitroreductase